MDFNVLYSESAAQLKEWQDILNEHDIPYERESIMKNGNAGIRTTAAGAALIRKLAGFENTVTPQMRKNQKANLIIMPIFALIFGGLMFVVCSDQAAEAAAREVDRDPRVERFEIGSPFFDRLTSSLRREAVRNPQTFEVEDYRMLTHMADSMVVVMEFSAENDYGVRQNHSVTVVADNDGNISRLVSAQ